MWHCAPYDAASKAVIHTKSLIEDSLFWNYGFAKERFKSALVCSAKKGLITPCNIVLGVRCRYGLRRAALSISIDNLCPSGSLFA
jgi:hypothetical protein